jgi:hypothetical protein
MKRPSYISYKEHFGSGWDRLIYMIVGQILGVAAGWRLRWTMDMRRIGINAP